MLMLIVTRSSPPRRYHQRSPQPLLQWFTLVFLLLDLLVPTRRPPRALRPLLLLQRQPPRHARRPLHPLVAAAVPFLPALALVPRLLQA